MAKLGSTMRDEYDFSKGKRGAVLGLSTTSRDFRLTVAERLARQPGFAVSMFDEALTSWLRGEGQSARLMLRELIESVLGFDELGRRTGIPNSSLRRAFTARGNLGMGRLAAVVRVLGDELQRSPKVVSELQSNT